MTDHKKIIENNEAYWNEHADLWFGTTALPEYGVRFPTEENLHLFGDVTGKKLLEVCCGSGHSLKYHAERGAEELWGIDFSQSQLENAAGLLKKTAVRRIYYTPKWKTNGMFLKHISIMYIRFME